MTDSALLKKNVRAQMQTLLREQAHDAEAALKIRDHFLNYFYNSDPSHMQSVIPAQAGILRQDPRLRGDDTTPSGCIDKKRIVAGTMPIKNELDPQPLMRVLSERGHILCLPVHQETGTPLVFRRYAFGDVLDVDAWGIGIPKPDKQILIPDIILCPLLAFDRTGARLGYGGGYYDATLKALRAQKKIIAIGLCYAAQEVESVPCDAHDERLDMIVTEAGIIIP